MEVTSKFRLSHLPRWRLTSHARIIRDVYGPGNLPVPAPLLSHKLVSRVGTIGMQWGYYAIVVTLKYEVK